MELVGARVILRDYVDDDLGPIIAYLSDERSLQFYELEVAPAKQARVLLDRFVHWAGEAPRSNYQLAIVERSAGQLIGSCGLRTVGLPAGSAEFGLELSPSWWGRGFAAESATLLLRFGFRELGLVQVRGASVSENGRIAKLVRKLGFSEAGTRTGDAWMQQKGWKFTDWVLTKDAWDRGANP